MYESGLSKKAKVLFLIMAIFLGLLFIRLRGCSAFADAVGDGAYELRQKGRVPTAFFLR